MNAKTKSRKTSHTRIYKDTLKRLKIEAAKKGISLVELLEEKLK